jgi:hypothetical protein
MCEAGLGYRIAVPRPFHNIPVMDVENCTYYEKRTQGLRKFCP